MIFNENMQLCKEKYKNVWTYMDSNAASLAKESVEVKLAKNSLPNISLELNDKTVYLHSQYDPQNEAQKWIEPYLESVKSTKHVFFFGAGMGYHIQLLMSKYPAVNYTIYEPLPAVLFQLLKTKHISVFPLKRLMNIFVGGSVDFYIRHVLDNFSTDVLVIVNPAYERIFPDMTREFMALFKKYVKHKLMNLQTNVGYQQIWTYNVECNFLKILKSQNMISSKKQIFKDKPFVIVAAGPSLEDEYVHLKKIKDDGLAYIFAVGSANKALLANDIMPDAVVSYDPNYGNFEVFKEVFEQKIPLPIVFGSTVGLKTLEDYPGPMLHMFMNQDHLSPYFLEGDNFNKEDVITDAASVAVVALQLVSKLGAELIVLVGQNFSYRNHQYYANGVKYNQRPTYLKDAELSTLIEVEDVDGGVVFTQEAHNVSRRQMEQIIATIPQTTILNTTRGGARIAGAPFETLANIIRNRLTRKDIVNRTWYEGEPTEYDYKSLSAKMEEMKKHHDALDDLILQIAKTLKKLEAAAVGKQAKKTSTLLDQIGKLNRSLYANLYYLIFLEPMVKVQYDFFQKAILEINSIPNIIEKARAVIKPFGAFVLDCQKVMQENEPFYQLIMNNIQTFTAGKLNDHTEGGIQYEHAAD
ncbi:motility associated factor glycosyltransferase family protein [Paenibacillus athensensis]|uniref:6-hydroxymethylpterin diphosphokinase MptE-like domain-containing protein n=1 Tax=Paenibacillus athensensis TaxID=1967502 RepID=A0A4Y8Q6P6_9BACL|nr:6-hydroxymethylpterin diphosphokinase MptE-like protein [Paenibacillus athensensis]MCD1260841.1 motility associated factor glycosyltransferase family protein [Paenibacillus athensensis]